MKINFKVRMNNPYFWIGLVALVFATVGVDVASLTSWVILLEVLKNISLNPFKIACIFVAVLGYINDPTTKGLSDSKKALTYIKPKKDV